MQTKLPPLGKNEWDYLFFLKAQKTLTATQAGHLAFLLDRIGAA
jgi:hypothetical protein